MNTRLGKGSLLLTVFLYGFTAVFGQDVTITINASQDKRAISPYIYGSNTSFDNPAEFYQDAGLRFARMNQGNNATKYNWRRKISSHPDCNRYRRPANHDRHH